MKRLLSLLLITTLFTGELEVEGDLKVSGNIDAQNQRIKNVGIPTSMSDAINAQVLHDALRDDGQYEYTVFFVTIAVGIFGGIPELTGASGWVDLNNLIIGNDLNSMDTFSNELYTLFNDGWQLQSINGEATSWWIFKRPIIDIDEG